MTSPSFLCQPWEAGQHENRANKSFNTTLSRTLRPDPDAGTELTLSIPPSCSTTAWNWQGVVPSLCSPGFSLPRLSCTRSFTLYCGHAFGPAVSEASNFMTNRHGHTRPFETVAPDPEQTLSQLPGWACMLSPKLRGLGRKIASFVRPGNHVSSQRALKIEIFR